MFLEKKKTINTRSYDSAVDWKTFWVPTAVAGTGNLNGTIVICVCLSENHIGPMPFNDVCNA